MTRAIACFERTIISAGSPWDRYRFGGDDEAISASARRGEALFFSQPLSCFRCHSGFNFTDGTNSAVYHNTAVYDMPLRPSYPTPNLGLFEYTRNLSDVGRFRAPTLRNIAVTAPYMHDGSVATLDAVLDHYSAGGKGSGNINKDPLIRGFRLSAEERADLLAFLRSLTDESVLHDPKLSDPKFSNPLR